MVKVTNTLLLCTLRVRRGTSLFAFGLSLCVSPRGCPRLWKVASRLRRRVLVSEGPD